MLLKLPLKIWRQAFDSLSPTDDRKKVALISNFGDREFSGDICQKWLHEWTEDVTLGPIYFNSPPPVEPLPEVEMPANIRDFKHIQISYVDVNVLQLMRRLQPLFHDVNMNILYKTEELETARTVFDHLFPLLTSIESVYLSSSRFLFGIRDRFPTQFLSIKRLELSMEHPTGEMFALLLSWLGTRRPDGQPRMLLFDNLYGNIQEIVQRIQQQFLDENVTTRASSFYFWILVPGEHEYDAVQESTTRNATTNEQLVIKKTNFAVQIGRCPAELDGQQWVDEMDTQRIGILHSQAVRKQIITISPPILGQNPVEEAKTSEEESEAEDEDFADQPGPSNQ